MERGVEPKDFNSYGARRGNDRVMVRGTFANVRLRNQLAPGTEGGVTIHLPSGEQMSIFDAAERYKAAGTPLLVLAGKEYGTKPRDWAARYAAAGREGRDRGELRTHPPQQRRRGRVAAQFQPGESWQSLGLTGHESSTSLG